MQLSVREQEEQVLQLCAIVAGDEVGAALDEREANVFRLAAMVLESKFSAESGRLRVAAARWFAAKGQEPLTVQESVDRGWLRGLPWLRDELTWRLERQSRSRDT